MADLRRACAEKTAELGSYRLSAEEYDDHRARYCEQIAACCEELSRRSDELEQIDQELAARKKELAELRAERDRLCREIAEGQTDAAQCHRRIAALEEGLSARDARLAERDRQAACLQQQVAAQGAELALQQQQLRPSRATWLPATWPCRAGPRVSRPCASCRNGLRRAGVAQPGTLGRSGRDGGKACRDRPLGGAFAAIPGGQRGYSFRRKRRLLTSGLFDLGYYLLHNPDVVSQQHIHSSTFSPMAPARDAGPAPCST